MRRRSALPAAFAAVVLVACQLLAHAHEAATRHVVCAEHGEQIEAVRLAGTDDGCEQSHWFGVDGDGGGQHADCEITRALHQASIAPLAPLLAHLAVVEAQPAVTSAPDTTVTVSALYRIAPKTSPPTRAG